MDFPNCSSLLYGTDQSCGYGIAMTHRRGKDNEVKVYGLPGILTLFSTSRRGATIGYLKLLSVQNACWFRIYFRIFLVHPKSVR
jgi:hypothetical protein